MHYIRFLKTPRLQQPSRGNGRLLLTAKITITTDDCSATVTIEDDGRGFYPETLSEASLRFGLKTMNDRARSVGANLQLDSAPDRGTKLTLRLPLVKANHHEAHPSIIG